MKLSDNVTIPPQVMARLVGDETVILDLASGTYYGLDPVGARIWLLMTEGQALAGICETLLDEFDVDRETLERDLLHLARELRARGLVSIATAMIADAGATEGADGRLPYRRAVAVGVP